MQGLRVNSRGGGLGELQVRDDLKTDKLAGMQTLRLREFRVLRGTDSPEELNLWFCKDAFHVHFEATETFYTAVSGGRYDCPI